MKTKHTPGPWESDWLWQTPEHLNGKRVIEIVSKHGKTIAFINRWLATCDDSHHDIDDECEANVRLIAAAPDLLAALKDCVTDPNAHCLTTENREVAMFKRLEEINRTVRAALAAAQGKE